MKKSRPYWARYRLSLASKALPLISLELGELKLPENSKQTPVGEKLLGVRVGVGLKVDVGVEVEVYVAKGVKVNEFMGVPVMIGVLVIVGVKVGVEVEMVPVGVKVQVTVGVGDIVGVGVMTVEQSPKTEISLFTLSAT